MRKHVELLCGCRCEAGPGAGIYRRCNDAVGLLLAMEAALKADRAARPDEPLWESPATVRASQAYGDHYTKRNPIVHRWEPTEEDLAEVARSSKRDMEEAHA